MQGIQGAEEEKDKEEQVKEEEEQQQRTSDPSLDPSPEYKYTQRAQRVKRAINPPNNYNRKSCSLFIQVCAPAPSSSSSSSYS